MGVLGSALQQGQASTPSLKSDNGVYRAQFLGLSEPFVFTSPWGDKCKLCKGAGTGRNGDGTCMRCSGSGNLTETHVKLIYKLENGNTEEEEVNFKLLPAGTSPSGQPLSPTTLFIRLRMFHGNRNVTPAELDEWYSALPKPIRIPCTVVIGDNKSGTASKITAVERRDVGAKAAPVPDPEPEPEEPFDDGDPF